MSDLTTEPQVLRWEDPPPRERVTGRLDWHPIADELRSKSGTWAVVFVAHDAKETEHRRALGLGHGISKAGIRAFAPAGEFEAQVRKIGAEVRVYARHVGGSA